MITKHWTICCDSCVDTEPQEFNYKPNKKELRTFGWRTKNKKHFCCLECFNSYEKEQGK